MPQSIVEARSGVDIRDLRRRGAISIDAESAAFLVGDQTCRVRLLKRTQGIIGGGTRFYFLCPLCNRTCERVFSYRTGLACRHCARLSYQIETLPKLDRNTEMLYRRRRRMGQEPNGAFDDWPDKPKGMRWTTYERKVEQLAKLEERANTMFGPSMAWLLARFG